MRNLAYGQVLFGLQKQNLTSGFSRGIVLNLHKFKGQVEMLNSSVSENMAVIPSAIFANFYKMTSRDSQLLKVSIKNFINADGNLVFEVNETTKLNRMIHLLNYFDPDNDKALLETFQMVSPILMRD